MIIMEMMGKIRRMYFRDKLSLHQIAKRTGPEPPKPNSRCTSGKPLSTSNANA
ncbi:hypothetical protein ACIPZF_24790 [Pseudomonas sp. NPDC089752]|uniref:hypothetical protein n=1 Tax=Pseudomonas sp. NPDC089752 TaxID=3364472 RepID=UPI0037F723FA